MGNRIEGKVAVVTGATNGIGAEISRLYAQEGAKVVLADLALEKAQEVADAIVKESGSEAIAVKCNVASKEEVQNVVDICVEKWTLLLIMRELLYRLAQLKISVRNSGKGCWILI